jgi:ABC-type dipeptide/oligopeptide/nickel transport system ATPase component
MTRLLEVKNLKTQFATRHGLVKAVDGVSFSVEKGETLALVGESGSGKSVTALSLMRLIQPPGRIVSGEIRFDGEDMAGMSDKQIRKIRGDRMAMVFQEPMTSLNPVLPIGWQVTEPLLVHRKIRRNEARVVAERLLAQVQIPDAAKRIGAYPHQFSGGMRQRAMIASEIGRAHV